MQLSHFLQLPLAQLATVLNSRLMALDSAPRPTATTPHGSSSAGKRSDSHDAGELHSDQRALKQQRMQAYGIAPLTGRTIPPGFVKAFLCIHK